MALSLSTASALSGVHRDAETHTDFLRINSSKGGARPLLLQPEPPEESRLTEYWAAKRAHQGGGDAPTTGSFNGRRARAEEWICGQTRPGQKPTHPVERLRLPVHRVNASVASWCSRDASRTVAVPKTCRDNSSRSRVFRRNQNPRPRTSTRMFVGVQQPRRVSLKICSGLGSRRASTPHPPRRKHCLELNSFARLNTDESLCRG
jgi:hypothetical protein